MKKFVLTLVLLFLTAASGNLMAQTLEFSQVLKRPLQYTQASTADPYIFVNDTVPTGKVWKIIGIGTSSWSGAVGSSNGIGCCVSQEFYVDHTRISNTSTFNAFPFWLPAGPHTLGMQILSSTSASTTSLINISIIEFNVVP